MLKKKPKVMITFSIGGENGGPYLSHRRITESKLQETYDFFPLYVPRIRNLLSPIGLYQFIKHIKINKPDIVHCTGLQLDGFLCVLACKMAGIKNIILAIHGSSNESLEFAQWKKKIVNFLEILTLKMTTICYGVSEYVVNLPNVRKYAKRCYGHIYNMPHRINEEVINKLSFRNEFRIKDTDIVIVSTGRINREKGYEILCKAIIQMEHKNNVKFVIVGNGAYLDEMKNEIKNNNLEESVIFLGYRKDVGRILSESDIFVTCTLHETLCNSIIEAGKECLPSVASNIGGIPEIIENRKNGILVPIYDDVAVAEALNELIANEKIRNEMGRNAKEIINNKFSDDKIVSQIDQLYRGIFNESNKR